MKRTLYHFLYIFFLSICFILPENNFGQQPLVRKISFLEGLTSDVVYDLFVDSNGLLYLGTDKGLVTYNGVHFEQIQILESLGNSISSLQQDQKGVVWCKNFANQLFYVKESKLYPDQNVKRFLKETENNLIDFCIGNDAIYLLTQKAVYRYANSKISKIFINSNDDSHYLNTIAFSKTYNTLYVSSPDYDYSLKKDVLVSKKASKKGQKILEIYKGKLVYNYKSLIDNCIINGETISLYNITLNTTFLNRLSATQDNLWLCTNKGIYEFDDKAKKFKDGFLKNIRITDIVQDLEGNHWISSLDEGLFLMPNRQIFELNLDFLDKHKKMSYTRIAKGTNENYFIGTNDGRVIETTPEGKKIEVYNTNWDNNIEFISFIGDTIMTNYGFFKIGKPKQIAQLNYFGKALQKDDKGNILIANPTFGGLIARDFKAVPNFKNPLNKYKTYKYGNEQINTLVLREKRTRSVLYNSIEQKYYFGFIDGLYVYDANGNEKEIKTQDQEPLIAMAMLENSDGSIWVASSQKGLFLLKNNKILKHISRKNGLSDNNCRRIEKDNAGIWIVTETGFDYYDFQTKRVQNAELNLCIKGITINDLAVYKNLIALATNQGIYYFNKNVLNNQTTPFFTFNDFLVNNKKVKLEKNIVLDYDQNNVNIKFNTIHYRSLGNYNYKYRLKGLDDKWYNLSSNAKNVNFLALTPGTYKFQINIKIGEKYTPIQEIDFEISKPFWLQIWFLTILIIGLVALFYFVYRWAEVKTRKSEELKEQLALSQLTALRSQMNPHFIFNVLNAVQGLIYSNQKSKASDYLGKFSDLMRRILETSDKNEVTIEKEFETIDLYISLEKARFDDDFEYKIVFPDEVDLSQHTIPSMIIQPFVENAIKHGLMHKTGLKIVEIKLELLENVWCFTIDDNGIGRKASEIINQKIKKHISFATKAIDNRVGLMNKTNNIAIDIEVIDKKLNNEESLGTRIKIYIPFSDK